MAKKITLDDVKKLLANSDFAKKLDSLGITVEEFVAKYNEEHPDINKLYEQFKASQEPPPPPPPPDHTCPPGQHWDDAQQKCVDDIITPPPPPPESDLLYDSNVHINWNGIPGDQQVVTGVYGEFKPNGKYFRMKASGSPRMILMKATKELILEHGGKYGRAYFGVCNYQSRLECDFKLDSCSNGASFKTRNRHQFGDVQSGASDKERQAGQGCGIRCDSVDNDLEVVHGTEISGPSSNISPKLEANKYYHVSFSQFDKNGKIHIVVEIDGKKVNEGDVNAPAQFFNKAEFESWSEFWVRLNADKGGRLTFKNLKMYRL